MRLKGTAFSGGTSAPPMALPPHAPGVVTAENYLEKALAWCRSSGRADGEHPVIRKDRDGPAWCAWTAFMQRIGMRTAFAEKHGELVVPTVFPWDFSMDADELRDSVWDVDTPPEPPVITPERRREMANMMRGIMPREMRGASLAPKRPRPPHLRSRYDDARVYVPMDLDLSRAK